MGLELLLTALQKVVSSYTKAHVMPVMAVFKTYALAPIYFWGFHDSSSHSLAIHHINTILLQYNFSVQSNGYKVSMIEGQSHEQHAHV